MQLGFASQILKLRTQYTRLSSSIYKRSYFTLPVPNALKDIVKMPFFRLQPQEKLISLWKEQFQNKDDIITDVMFEKEFDQIKKNISHSPQFIIPVSKIDMKGQPTSRLCNLYAQFQDSRIGLLTTVEAVKKNPGGKCPPIAVITFFPELLFEKGIVFVRCDIVEKNQLAKKEVSFCWEYLRAFYHDSNLYSAWVELFNHRPREFDYSKFINQTSPIRKQLMNSA